jgi:Protein of unknown function (DUF2846)
MSGLKKYALAVLILTAMPVSASFGASTTTYATLHASEPPIADGQGRFYFYREGGFVGAALQPSVYINGETTGARAKPGDYFYVDRPAGSYEISTTTEKKEAVTMTLAAGQSLYVRFDVSMGFFVGHVSPSIIDPQQALKEIGDCDFHPPKVEPAKTDAAQPAPAQPAPSTAAQPPEAQPAPAPSPK